MAGLPNEILLEIFSHLDLAGAKNMRLACHRLEGLGLQFTLREFLVACERGFASIISISKLRKAAKQVRALTYSRVLLIEDCSVVDALVSSKIYNPNHKDRCTLFKELKSKQKRMIQGDEDFMAFQTAFAKFTKLETIDILCGAPIGFREDYHYQWSGKVDEPPPESPGVRELRVLQKSVLQARQKIKSLRVKYLSYEYFDQTSYQAFGQAWASLTKLDLFLIPSSDEIWQQHLKHAVQQLPRLRELRLQFCYRSEPELTPLSSVLDSNFTWSDLVALTLQGCVSDEHYFVQTMNTGLHKIKCLTLGEFQFTVPKVRPVLRFIREKRLEKVSLLVRIGCDKECYEDSPGGELEQIAQWMVDPQLPWPKVVPKRCADL